MALKAIDIIRVENDTNVSRANLNNKALILKNEKWTETSTLCMQVITIFINDCFLAVKIRIKENNKSFKQINHIISW